MPKQIVAQKKKKKTKNYTTLHSALAFSFFFSSLNNDYQPRSSHCIDFIRSLELANRSYFRQGSRYNGREIHSEHCKY